MYNSYKHIDKELDEFVLDTDVKAKDYMFGADISWVAQVKPFIEQFSNIGDLVFDPFAGLGTTLLGAGLIGRKSIGIEINKVRFAELQKRIRKYDDLLVEKPQLICGDALKIEYPQEADLVLTNFPYFHTTPISEKGNIYSVNNYQIYLRMIEEIIIKCKAVIKKNGYMLVFTENIRLTNGNMLPQAYDICKILQKNFNLKEEHIVLYNKSNIEVDDCTYTNRSHEYVYVAKQNEDSLDMQIFKSALENIKDKFKYVVVGTYALMLHPEGVVLDNQPSDLDIFVSDSEEAINIAHILTKEGYFIFSWEDKIDSHFDKNKLKGRHYLRARKEIVGYNYLIDITYESSIIEFNHLYENSIVANGQRIACVEDIKTLLKSRNSDKDKSLIFRISEFEKQNNETI